VQPIISRMARYAGDCYGLRMVNGALNVPASSSVGGNEVYYYGLNFSQHIWEASNYYSELRFSPVGQAPVLSLLSNPPNPSIPSTMPLGATVATVATITASWRNGQPFTGTIGFGPPSSNAGGVFAIGGNSLIINPSGPDVGASGG
jgi:hypothetical protein